MPTFPRFAIARSAAALLAVGAALVAPTQAPAITNTAIPNTAVPNAAIPNAVTTNTAMTNTAMTNTAGEAASGQPYAPNWFPADLSTWSPGTDPDAAFNRSTTPLVARVQDALTAADPAGAPRRVLATSVFANTDGNPSQGSPDFDYYTSEFWQYIDTLVFWGGSASEGLILAPNPTVTDAAHRNGVPVYGTVFFPPDVFGGQLERVRQLLEKDASGAFPAAAKLAEIADFYGFEGWFINQETEGADAPLAGDMRDFVAALRTAGSDVIWYDAMNETGEVGWRGGLDELNDSFFATSNAMFVDFRWDLPDLPASAAYARGMQRDPAELYAGVDTGFRQFAVQPDFDAIFPSQNPSGLSVALYRPDFTLTGTDDKTQYAARESRFWVGADGDPATPTPDADGWQGVAAKVSEHTPVTRTPFVTTFNTGHGRLWAHDGRSWQRGPWNNLTAQDVLPTWRWLVRGAGLSVGFDHETAWLGGSSLRLTGRLDQPTTVPLYATRLRVQLGTRVELTASGDVRLDVVARFADAPDHEVVVPTGQAGSGWTDLSANLSPYAGRTLVSLGVRLRGEPTQVDVHVGRLALLRGHTPLPHAASGVRVQEFDDGVRVRWSPSPSASRVLRYDVEAVRFDGTRTWLGATTGTAFFGRPPTDATRISVVPLGLDGRRGPGVDARR
jgi:endo-beta-N-acetylglucosaminidase D